MEVHTVTVKRLQTKACPGCGKQRIAMTVALCADCQQQRTLTPVARQDTPEMLMAQARQYGMLANVFIIGALVLGGFVFLCLMR